MASRPCQWALLAVAAASAAQRAAALQVAPTSAPTSAPTNGTNGTEMISVASGSAVTLTWVLAASGVSCDSACGDGACSETEMQGLDTDAEMEAAAISAGNPCDSSLPKGYTEYPVIDDQDDSCAYLRSDPPLDSCPFSDATRLRMCYCQILGGDQWALSALGESCTAACSGVGGRCKADDISAINTKAAVSNLAETLSAPCDQTALFFAFDYPSVTTTGHCTYTHSGGANTCDRIHDQCAGRRLCACEDMSNPPPEDQEDQDADPEPDPDANPDDDPSKDPNARGDPHLTNMHGEKFDINKEGLSTFLLFPRSVADGEKARLRVDARITHPKAGNSCRGFFITKVWISGSMVGDEIELGAHGFKSDAADALLIKIGKNVMNSSTDITQAMITKPYHMKWRDQRRTTQKGHANNRIRFAQLTVQLGKAKLVIDWITGKKKPNSMNIKAATLKTIGTDWGGLLGGDDHFWVSQFNSECKEAKSYDTVPQLLQYDSDHEWTATASLS